MRKHFQARQVHPNQAETRSLSIDGNQLQLAVVRNPRARRYLLRVQDDGGIRVTIPRGGSLEYALEFVGRNAEWIQAQQLRRRALLALAQSWTDGTRLLVRGEYVVIRATFCGETLLVQFGDNAISIPRTASDLRPAIESYLRVLSEKELIARTWQLANNHDLPLNRVVIRNQRSRWGSCSAKRTISLNWRLIQAPAFVQDYLILHELAHLREMNHSARFWQRVESMFPDYLRAEAWLNEHAGLLYRLAKTKANWGEPSCS